MGHGSAVVHLDAGRSCPCLDARGLGGRQRLPRQSWCVAASADLSLSQPEPFDKPRRWVLGSVRDRLLPRSIWDLRLAPCADAAGRHRPGHDNATHPARVEGLGRAMHRV